MTVQEAKFFGKAQLVNSPSALLDCEVFLQEILECSKTQLLFSREKDLTPEQEKKFLSFVDERKTGLPVAYITGHKEFFGYDFYVCPEVLIPKPDTEILVEKGIDELKNIFDSKKASPQKIKILDMCTGSGCVGLSIFKTAFENKIFSKENAPQLFLADISENALAVAKKNLASLLDAETQKSVFLVKTNLFENINETFDLIVSNPPYVPHSESIELLKDGRNEPLLALDGDAMQDGKISCKNDGLFIIRNLVPEAYKYLKTDGSFLCESGEYNAEETLRIFKDCGFCNTKIFKDLEGQLRVSAGKRK